MSMLADPIRQRDRPLDQGTTLTAPMDAYRRGDVTTVPSDLPGVDPSTIDLQVEREELRLSARRASSLPEGARYFVRERTETVVSRRVMLGDVLDVDPVDAEHSSGVLTRRIPLHEHAELRKVQVHNVTDAKNDRPVRSVETS